MYNILYAFKKNYFMHTQPIVGIPRALLYHKYSILWENFFKNLHVKVMISPLTNKQILSEGLNLTIDENCLPMKIFLGHVDYLQSRVTHLFIPRIASINKNEENCTKFWALYDTVATSFPEAKVVGYNIDKTKGYTSEFLEMMKLGFQFTKNPFKVFRAYRKAKAADADAHKKKLDQQKIMLRKDKDLPRFDRNLKILIFAHPYIIQDEFIGRQIINFFKKEHIDVIFSYITDPEKARKASKSITQDLYWTYHKELVGSIAMNRHLVDGVVYLAAFSCGPDALVVELCKRIVNDVPSVLITLDELQSDGGIITRLESFVDIIRFRKKKLSKRA